MKNTSEIQNLEHGFKLWLFRVSLTGKERTELEKIVGDLLFLARNI